MGCRPNRPKGDAQTRVQLALQVDGPEVLVASFVILSGWAIYKQHEAASAKQAVESPAEMLLLPASKVDVLGASSNTRFVPKASDVELIVVKPDKALGKSSSTPVRGMTRRQPKS